MLSVQVSAPSSGNQVARYPLSPKATTAIFFGFIPQLLGKYRSTGSVNYSRWISIKSMNDSIHKAYSRFPNHSVYNGFAQ
jgi:hypothetical protein